MMEFNVGDTFKVGPDNKCLEFGEDDHVLVERVHYDDIPWLWVSGIEHPDKSCSDTPDHWDLQEAEDEL